jgi:signal transduction histidine kinase
MGYDVRRAADPGEPRSEDHLRRLAEVGTRIAEAAHEIRDPLSLIVGSLDHLETKVRAMAEHSLAAHVSEPSTAFAEATDTALALLRICRQGAARLATVAEQLGDYSRAEAQPAPAGRVDLPRVLRSAADLVARVAPHPVPVVLDLPALPAVRGDEVRLGQLFTNLLRNAFDALEHVPEAVVQVTASERAGDEPPCVEVRVRDNGPGIPLRDRQRVFEPFFSGKRAGGGLGLGLAIARQIVEADGGTISIAPDPPPGTELVIRLRLAP